MKKHRRGDRKRRWRLSCIITGAIEICFGTAIFILSNYSVFGFILLLGFLFLASLETIDYKRGWKINYTIPKRAWRSASKLGVGGEVARAAIADTLEEAADPNRQRYAFQKTKKVK